jgi:hypothetical protein
MSMSIVRLLGHSFGDGYIHKSKSYFIYTNSAKELLNEVSMNVTEAFGNVPSCARTSIGGTPQIQFSAMVGRELNKLGAPRGSKTKQPTVIPLEVMRGKEDARADFLGSLCDDEAQVRTDSGSKQITLKTAKLASLEAELEDYLNQIGELFESLEIKCSTPKRDRTYVRGGEKKISKRVWITGSTNFATFAQKIVLNHTQKQAQLHCLLQSR